ncbi:hypothetical protein BpHYR1_007462 [Brachionus plicatilis]|uniref:Uncharacterized protein n=1 Tax=Brachionus plicatilis TaxID=10195 RepID=A0A3M7Q5P9_BRAPC|nr:hypothetical protein BpHYR1_007462 [Brachionus plicatilis]
MSKSQSFLLRSDKNSRNLVRLITVSNNLTKQKQLNTNTDCKHRIEKFDPIRFCSGYTMCTEPNSCLNLFYT